LEIWSLVLRTVVIYLVVFLVMRMMGKREIGKLTVLDLVISIMIAEIAVIVIEDIDRSLLDGILPMVVLMIIQVGTALLSMYSRKMRLLLDGKPSVIITKGKINKEEMRKQRYNLDDLMLQLRENKLTSVADVEFAILETSGKLSIIPKETTYLEEEDTDDKGKSEGNRDNVSPMSTPKSREKIIPAGFRYEMLPIPLIMDGKVQDENLSKIGKTRFWLKNALQEHKVTDFKDVFLCTIDHRGKLFVDVNQKKIT